MLINILIIILSRFFCLKKYLQGEAQRQTDETNNRQTGYGSLLIFELATQLK